MDNWDLGMYMEQSPTFQHVYRDEPILYTAAQMQPALPEKYREMRALSFQSGTRAMTSAEIFYKQAQFMAQYEDDFEFKGEFFRYYPTYQSMSDRQLRGYFSWRTKVRRGEIKRTSLSFAYVYVYELLHCIGADTPQEAFDMLVHFADVYSALDMRIRHYITQWIQDFAVYYDLPPEVLAENESVQFDRNLAVLRLYEINADETLFPALCALSTYNPERSRLFKTYPELMRAVACDAFRELSRYYGAHRKYDLCEAYFGRLFTSPFTMFYSAIFYPTRPAEDREYALSALTTFSCRNGRWTCSRVWGNRGKSADLGALMRAVDCLLRVRLSFPHPLKAEKIPKYLVQILEHCMDRAQQREREQAAREVHIDLSRLQSIRDAADQTRERLIVEETDPQPADLFEPVQEDAAHTQPPIETTPEKFAAVPVPPDPLLPQAQEDSPELTQTEIAVLRGILRGEDMRPFLQKQGLLLSVVAETINEKCFDYFADTVLLFESDIPSVPQEYVPQVKGWIQ